MGKSKKRGDSMKIYEVTAKSVLTPSRVPGMVYSLNPYVGCSFSCRYCYASFMTRFNRYKEPWGNFVKVKVNAPNRFEKELTKKHPGKINMSTVCDPYQPIEAHYNLTRACLEVFAKFRMISEHFPVSILTKSPLILRDVKIIKQIPHIEVGFTISTDDERILRLFEPYSPPLKARLRALQDLKEAGIKTYVLVAPALPMHPHKLAEMIKGLADNVYVDCLNYSWKVKHIYHRAKLDEYLDESFCLHVKRVLKQDNGSY